MKLLRLIVMRHAKSDWHTGAQTDHERPLNDRGRRDAPRMGQRLRDIGWTPQQVFSSDSCRTRQTFELMQDSFGNDVQVQWLSSLYHAGHDAARRVLAPLPLEVSPVMLLGHNPGWEILVSWLSGEHESMPTAACALLDTPVPTWDAAVSAPRLWRLVEVLRPKDGDD